MARNRREQNSIYLFSQHYCKLKLKNVSWIKSTISAIMHTVKVFVIIDCEGTQSSSQRLYKIIKDKTKVVFHHSYATVFFQKSGAVIYVGLCTSAFNYSFSNFDRYSLDTKFDFVSTLLRST